LRTIYGSPDQFHKETGGQGNRKRLTEAEISRLHPNTSNALRNNKAKVVSDHATKARVDHYCHSTSPLGGGVWPTSRSGCITSGKEGR